MADQPGTLANQSSRLSFTVRRPSPVSSRQSSAGPESNATTPAPSFRIPPPPRQKSGYSTNPSRLKNEQTEEEIDSSDEEDPEAAELVSGFDSMGVQRVKPTPKTNGPLVIPALKNRDWRQLARQRQAATGYIPDSARAAVVTGSDGSQGGMGTRDSINSGPQLTGLIFKKQSPPPVEPDAQEIQEAGPQVDEDTPMAPAKPLTEDELALQALLRGTDETTSKPQVAAIPLAPLTEEEALKRDMEDLPDVASLEDYSRVPVEQFGMAILRGMGWKPPASGEEELWLPAERPALLGLGAKARPTPQGSGSARAPATNWKNAERKYVPLIKKDRDGDVVDDAKGSANGRARSGQGSRRGSRSRSPQGRSDSSRRARERDDYRDGAREYRDRDKEYRDRDRQDRDRDRDYRRDKGRESERERDRYGRDGYREREKDDDRRRKDEDGSRRRDRDRDSARDDDRAGSSRRKGDKDYDSRR